MVQENFNVMQGVDAAVVPVVLFRILLGSAKITVPQGFGAYLTLAFQPLRSGFVTSSPRLTFASWINHSLILIIAPRRGTFIESRMMITGLLYVSFSNE